MEMNSTLQLCADAKAVVKDIAILTTEEKNRAINVLADELLAHTADILAANEIDVENAKGKISDVMIDRLRLTEDRIKGMADGMREVACLPDPVGRVLDTVVRPSGIRIEKTSVPLGVVAVIYESRPNVTSDAATLAFKSGNACVLRGGKESYNSSLAVVTALKEGLAKCGIPTAAIGLVSDLTRQSATDLMTAVGFVDLLIPRGGAGLIKNCVDNAKIPCIQTGTGICHVYVDESADMDMALNIINNAKTSRPSVCNAEEVCLVNEKIAKEFLPKLKARLVDEKLVSGETPVELRLCPKAKEIIDGVSAGSDDFDTEFLDYILAVRVVSDVDDAIAHIAAHSTGHSEAIITSDKEAEKKFLSQVDSAAVYVNASTRFTDGGEFGLGCEIGISTQKLHARGPVGLGELNTYKYIIRGNGQIR